MDVISTLPHPETPIILVEMVKKGYITSDVYGAVLINVASLLVTPSPAVINTFVVSSSIVHLPRETERKRERGREGGAGVFPPEGRDVGRMRNSFIELSLGTLPCAR